MRRRQRARYLQCDIERFAQQSESAWCDSKPMDAYDVSRSRDFKRRIAFGPVGSWDVDLAGRLAHALQVTVAFGVERIGKAQLDQVNHGLQVTAGVQAAQDAAGRSG